MVTRDRRLQDRAHSQGSEDPAKLRKAVLELPDSADNIESPSADELEALGQTLSTEKKLRDERIEVARKRRPAIAKPVHAAAPLDDEL